MPSIKYSIETEVGLFNSTLTLPEGHTYTDDEIEQLKQAYADTYVMETRFIERDSTIRNLKKLEIMRRTGEPDLPPEDLPPESEAE